MANVLANNYKESLLLGTYDLSSATVKADLIDTGVYTFSSAHDFYDDLSGVVDAGSALSSKTTTNGTFDAADDVHSSVTGNTIEAIWIWIDTAGASSTDPLVAFFDTSITGAPVTPNGGDITIQWNGSGIFAL